jgi:Cu2+-exporting ATPase
VTDLLIENSEQLARSILEVGGMKCAGCAATVERQLLRELGVNNASVNLVTEVAVIEYSPSVVQPDELAKKLTSNGFPSKTREHTRLEQQSTETKETENINLAVLLLILSSIGHIEHLGGPKIPYLSSVGLHWGLASIALLHTSRSTILEGIKGLIKNSPNMNSLVALGSLSAYATSMIAWFFPILGWECFFEEPVMLLSFILIGRSIEKKARNRAKSSLTNLISLQPKLASLMLEGNTLESKSIEIPIDQIKVGDRVLILPGEKLPIDGKILVGSSTLDESMITGESIPVLKNIGEKVVGGSVNLTGSLIVQVEQIGSQTILSQIIEAVETAQSRKAPVQYLADRVAGYFTYAVMSISFVTFGFWYLWGHSFFQVYIQNSSNFSPSPLIFSLKLSIAVLVIACPCALGLATPTAILVGTSIAAEKGILVKGGDILEKIHQLKTLVFDKTGTLTIGHPVITDYLTLGEHKVDELLQISASAESTTYHIYGLSIQKAAKEKELTFLPVENIQNIPGRGIIARISGETILVGNQIHLEENSLDIDESLLERTKFLIEEGKTIIYVSRDEEVIGALALIDELRPDAKSTVAKLQEMGVEVFLVTGDHEAIAQKIALDLGINQVHAGITPQGKALIIKELQESKSIVGMIGDGINDAPALAQADLGISLAGATDLAQKTASVILMKQRLSDVILALELSRATFGKIQQNLIFAFGYNLLFIPIAAGIGIPHFSLGPALAGAFMASSSILVVLNSLLLNQRFPKNHNE